MQCHVLVHRPYIRILYRLCELLFHDYLFRFRILNAACAKHHLYIWRYLMYYLHELAVKIRNALIGRPFCKAEPVARILVIHSQEHSSEGLQILSDSPYLFIGYIRIGSQCESNVLTVSPYIPHAGERFILSVALKSALVGEVIIIRVVPLELDFRILHHFRYPAGKLLVQRIIAVHQAYAPVGSAQLVKYVILIYILSSLRTVTQIQSTFSLSHVDRIYLVFVHKNPPFHPSVVYISTDEVTSLHHSFSSFSGAFAISELISSNTTARSLNTLQLSSVSGYCFVIMQSTKG